LCQKAKRFLEWHKSVPYAALAEVFERIDSTTKRLEIAAYLTAFLTSVIERTPGDLIKVIYLCINRVSRCLHTYAKSNAKYID